MAFLKYANAKIVEAGLKGSALAGLKSNPNFKIASQSKLAEIDEDRYFYFRARFVSASDHPANNPDNPWTPGADGWGCNGNGDAFEIAEMRKHGSTWDDAACYYNHNNTDPERAFGYVYAWRLDETHGYIEGIVAVERGLDYSHALTAERKPFPTSDDIIQKIESGKIKDVSMGCMVEESICSICQNIARNEFEYCEHIPMKLGTVGGQLVYELNRGCNWFEITIIPEDGQGAGQNEKIAPITLAASDKSKNSFAENIKFVKGGQVMKRAALKKVAQDIIQNSKIDTAKPRQDYGDNMEIMRQDQGRAKKTTTKETMKNTEMDTALDRGDYKLARKVIEMTAKRTGHSLESIARKVLAEGEEGLTTPPDVRSEMDDIQDQKRDAIDEMEQTREQAEAVDLEQAEDVVKDIQEDVQELVDALGLDVAEDVEEKQDEDQPEEAETDEEESEEMEVEGMDGTSEGTPIQSGEGSETAVTGAVMNVLYKIVPGLKAKHEAKQKERKLARLKKNLPELYAKRVAAKRQFDESYSDDKKQVAAKLIDDLTDQINNARTAIRKLTAAEKDNTNMPSKVDRGDYGSAAQKFKEDQGRAKKTTEKATITNADIQTALDRGDYKLARQLREKMATGDGPSDSITDPGELKPNQGSGELKDEFADTPNKKKLTRSQAAKEIERMVATRKRVRESKKITDATMKAKTIASLNMKLRQLCRVAGIVSPEMARKVIHNIEAGQSFAKASSLLGATRRSRKARGRRRTAGDPVTKVDRGNYGSNEQVMKRDSKRTKARTSKVKPTNNPMKSQLDRQDYPHTAALKPGDKVTKKEARSQGQPGSVSSGTMQPRDLIPTFLELLKELDTGNEYTKIIQEGERIVESGNLDSEEASMYLNEDLFDALDSFAPEGHYFGAHPGDGADYGFWQAEGEGTEAEACAPTEATEAGLYEPEGHDVEAQLETEPTGLNVPTEKDAGKELNLLEGDPAGLEPYMEAAQTKQAELDEQAQRIVEAAGNPEREGKRSLTTVSFQTAGEANKKLDKRRDVKGDKGAFARLEHENQQLKKTIAKNDRQAKIAELVSLALEKGIIKDDDVSQHEQDLLAMSDSQLEAVAQVYIGGKRQYPNRRPVPRRPKQAFQQPIDKANTAGSNDFSLWNPEDC